MLEVSAALEIVLRHAAVLRAERVALGPDVLGRVLGETVLADIDSPPFTKALMDGFAVRAADCPATLRIIGEVPAGAAGGLTVSPGEAAAVYTGAPLPAGADAVVMSERVQVAGDRVTVPDAVSPGQHVLPRAAETAAGQPVLPAGTVISPVAVGLLAAVGRTHADVNPAPRVAVLPTGNELIDPPATPGPGQIRNSNGPMLAAQAVRAGAVAVLRPTARDDADALRAAVAAALSACDVLVLAGGVSAGKFDLVPAALDACGVAAHFHKVRLKPGKPLLFGTAGEKLVFGLPGNPVSSYVCFELFARPAIRRMMGLPPGLAVERAPLAVAFAVRNDRPTYHPAVAANGAVAPLPWQGSADLRALLPANALLVLPAGDVTHRAGELVDVIRC